MVIPRTWIRKEVVFFFDSRPQGEWDRVAELMMIKYGESGHRFSVPRVHCPEERSKAKVVKNYQYTSALIGVTIATVFRAIIYVNQLNIHGAVSDLFEKKNKACPCNIGETRAGRTI